MNEHRLPRHKYGDALITPSPTMAYKEQQFKNQISQNHQETKEQTRRIEEDIRRKADARGQTEKNNIPLVDINKENRRKIKFEDNDTRTNVRYTERGTKNPKQMKIKKRNRLLRVFFSVALVTSMAGGFAVTIQKQANYVPESSYGQIYNDPNGFTRFSNEQDLMDYCNVNNYDITSLVYNIDSAGTVSVGNSSFVQNTENMEGSSVEQTPTEASEGEIYNDPAGYTTFDNEQELIVYCEMNNIDYHSLKYNFDSAGKVTVGNTSLGLTDTNQNERTI